MDFDLTQKMTSAEKVRSTKILRNMKQQVNHERQLKLDAFHEVDKLIGQVCVCVCVCARVRTSVSVSMSE